MPRTYTPEQLARKAETNREYARAHRARINETARAKYKDNLETKRAYYAGHKRGQRRKAFEALGGECLVCGAREGLSIDHVNGGGRRERREGKDVHVEVLAGRREDVRCLCIACNHFARRDVFGPDISKWPREILEELEGLKEFRQALRRMRCARLAS